MVNIIMISIFYLSKASKIRINPYKLNYTQVNNSKLNYHSHNLKYNKSVYWKFIPNKIL